MPFCGELLESLHGFVSHVIKSRRDQLLLFLQINRLRQQCWYFGILTAGTYSRNAELHRQNHPVAGEGFILKGGDTWVASDSISGGSGPGIPALHLHWGRPDLVYRLILTRPIFTCGGGSCSYTANGGGFYTDWSGVQYVTVDDIEFTGLYEGCSANPEYVQMYGSYDTVERSYFHGWSHAAQSCGASDGSVAISQSTCCGGGIGDVIHDNVIDGSDTTEDMMYAISGNPTTIYNNVIKYVTNGTNGSFNDAHMNWIGPIVLCYTSGGCHQNSMQNSAATSGNCIPIYDNIITGNPAGGSVKLWVGQGSGSTSSTVSYVFNNILFNNVYGNDVDLGQNEANLGTVNIFNNTFECDGAGCVTGMTSSGVTMTVNWTNNHCIITSGPCVNSPGGVVAVNIASSLNQTVKTANGQGYLQGAAQAWEPAIGCTPATCSTMQTGTSQNSTCNTLSGISATAGAACQNATGYACTYNTTNHTVSCPASTPKPVSRPLSGIWDIGAYQTSPVPPPTNPNGTVTSN